jgi:hypothetical protein
VNQRKSILIVLILSMLAIPSLLLAAETGNSVSFSIRFYDRRIYYLEQDPVYIQVTITNNSPSVYRFRLADDRAFSVDFDVRTVTNRSIDPAETLIRKRTSSGQVFFREITVESGESFSFVEDLRDFAGLKNSGAFIIQARIYPELYRPDRAVPAAVGSGNSGSGSYIESNRLSLNIRPPAMPGPGGIPVALDTETNANLVREKLSPDQVVEYFINARQRSQWEKYFLYLDIEALLSRDPVRKRQWLTESEEGRRYMMDRYRTELRQAAADSDIATLPSEYEIERTVYNNSEGTVTAVEKFKSLNFTEKKRYTYYLQRKEDIWTIVDYSVVNLGTE